jgi:hypothetical protein
MLFGQQPVNPRNILYITACPVDLEDRTGMVDPPLKFQDFGQLPFFKGHYK